MPVDLNYIMQSDGELHEKYIAEFQFDFARKTSVSQFPETGKALHILFSKCLLLKNALFKQAEDDDVHTMLILHRSYIDHFMKHTFIYLKQDELQSDDCGRQYYNECLMKNELDTMHGLECSQTLFSSKFRYPSAWDEVESVLKTGKGEIDKNDLEDVVEQFYVPNIFLYLNTLYLDGKLGELDTDIFRKMIFGYFEYKSYVYGEPWNDDELRKISDDSERTILVLRICTLVFNSFLTLMGQSYAFMARIAPGTTKVLKSFRSYRIK
jgi:hypothetical protein